MLPKILTFVDIETTGTSLRADRIIEIGILRVEDNKLVRTFKSLVNPECFIPEHIVGMTGINPGEVENAPTFRQIQDEINEILDEAVFVAHNVRFDYSFIKQEFFRLEKSFSPKHFCTVKLSRALYPQFKHHNLDSLSERHGFQVLNRHRAFDDAEVLWKFYQHVQEEFETEKLTKTVDLLLKRPTVPMNIPQKYLDDLPETPGVYIFYGSSGIPLYIGKSKNLRRRVLSHFSSDQFSSTEMKITQQIESLETIETAGELGALLKEASMIKKHQPLYNQRLRYARLMTVLKKITNPDGYECINLEENSDIDPSSLENIMGIFRSRKQAKEFLVEVSTEFNLCQKLLGVEKTSQACFGHRLGKCAGACLKNELPIKYNLRFLEAFGRTKLRKWPFDGPIVIKELSVDGQKSEGFVVDQWMCIGTIKLENNSPNLEMEQEIRFDLDTYKILNSYLKSSAKAVSVEPFKKLNLGSDPESYNNHSDFS